jgi:methylamine---glutamate N-methyltransferase subunit C
MNEPIIADNKPIRTRLERGKEYFFCACGRSARQPFCDGSHKGTGIEPKKFIAPEDGVAWLCCCKHTANAPFCDGTHKQYPDDQVGKA